MKKQRLLTALLSIAFCLCVLFGFANVETASAAPAPTTAADMLQNSDDLRPAFNYAYGERLAIDNGAISCWEDGHFFYCDEVDAVAFDITFSAGSDICFALRTDGGGQMWTSRGYYAFAYQNGAGGYVELYKVTDCGAWQTAETQLAKGDIANIFDGKAHSIVYSFDEATGALSFTVDGTTIAGQDNGTAIAKANSNFKIARVNSVALYTVTATASSEPSQPEATKGIAITDETMHENPNKLLPAFNYGGAERLKVENGQVESWADGNFFYNDLVDSASFTFTAGAGQSMLFVGLHLNSVAVPWVSTGYYAFIQGNVVGLYKIDSTNISNWESGLLGDKVTCSSNIFDGAEHKVAFAVKGNELFIQINEESMTLAFSGDAIPVDGTEFGMSSNGTGTFRVGESTLSVPIVEKEYTGAYTNMETLIASGALVPDYNYDSVANNFYCYKENGFVYANEVKLSVNASLTAIDFDIVVTAGKSMFFSMRATQGGNIWENRGYAVWLDGTTLKFWDLSTGWHDAPDKTVEGIVNIYDGKQHNIKMYAFDDESGYVQIGFAIDNGEFVKYIDTTDVLTLGAQHTEFWMKSVNDESVRFMVTAPAGTTHNFGDAVATAPTCTKGGYTETVCADCAKKVISDETAATGHSYNAVTTDPTCLVDGYVTYTCGACGDTYQEAGEKATGHNYETTVTAPTCEDRGYTQYVCACGDSYQDSFVDELGHNMADATCTAPETCTVCGTTEGEALGHTFGNWVVVKEATTTEEGEKTRTCACGETESETIPVIEETSEEPTSESADTTSDNTSTESNTGDLLGGCLATVSGSIVGLITLCCGAFVLRKKND